MKQSYDIKDKVPLINNKIINPYKFNNKDCYNLYSTGPWYEEAGITYQEVRHQMFEHFKYKVDDFDSLKKTIDEIVHPKLSLGSYRGYYTFQHSQLKNEIFERLQYLNIKIKINEEKNKQENKQENEEKINKKINKKNEKKSKYF